MFQFLKSILGAHAVRTRRSQPVYRKARPVLEFLEGRTLMDGALLWSASGAAADAVPTDQFSLTASTASAEVAAGAFSWGESQNLPVDLVRIDAATAAGVNDGADVAMPDPDGDTDDRPPVPPIPLAQRTAAASDDAALDASAAYNTAPAFDFDKLVASSFEEKILSGMPGYGASSPATWLAEKVVETAALWLWDAITEPSDNGGGGGTEGAGPTSEDGAGGTGPADDDDSDDDDDDYPVPWEVLREVDAPPETKGIVAQGMEG